MWDAGIREERCRDILHIGVKTQSGRQRVKKEKNKRESEWTDNMSVSGQRGHKTGDMKKLEMPLWGNSLS